MAGCRESCSWPLEIKCANEAGSHHAHESCGEPCHHPSLCQQPLEHIVCLQQPFTWGHPLSPAQEPSWCQQPMLQRSSQQQPAFPWSICVPASVAWQPAHNDRLSDMCSGASAEEHVMAKAICALCQRINEQTEAQTCRNREFKHGHQQSCASAMQLTCPSQMLCALYGCALIGCVDPKQSFSKLSSRLWQLSANRMCRQTISSNMGTGQSDVGHPHPKSHLLLLITGLYIVHAGGAPPTACGRQQPCWWLQSSNFRALST